MTAIEMDMRSKKPLSEADRQKNREIGNRIVREAEQKGYKVQDIGPMIGLTSNAASQWKGGYVRPSMKNLQKLADKLETSVAWLMNGEHPDEMAKAQTNTEFEVLQLMREIPADDHDAAIKMLRGLRRQK